MLENAKCFREQPKVKTSLCTGLLVSALLDAMYKSEIINSVTYVKAIKEAGDIERPDVSK